VEEAVSLADLPRGGVNGSFAAVEFHDTCRPEERPLLNLVNQMVSFEDDRGVNPVFVDGRMVREEAGLPPWTRSTSSLSTRQPVSL